MSTDDAFLALVRELLHYSPDTGLFTWRVNRRTVHAGDLANRGLRNGYARVRINRKSYGAHRLAWFYTHGVWPNIVDHINGDRLDNRLTNLRDCDHRTNGENRRVANANNKSSGLLGVTINNKTGRWLAFIKVNRVSRYLGSHETPEAAHEAYLRAKRLHHKGGVI